MTDPDLCVCVTTPTGEQMYPTATAWEVTDRRVLKLTGADASQVAEYNAGGWTSVTLKTPTPA